VLAFHHACAGLIAQGFYISCLDFHNERISLLAFVEFVFVDERFLIVSLDSLLLGRGVV
jgi:hypothetical protein